jgi:hypothetical protein
MWGDWLAGRVKMGQNTAKIMRKVAKLGENHAKNRPNCGKSCGFLPKTKTAAEVKPTVQATKPIWTLAIR